MGKLVFLVFKIHSFSQNICVLRSSTRTILCIPVRSLDTDRFGHSGGPEREDRRDQVISEVVIRGAEIPTNQN